MMSRRRRRRIPTRFNRKLIGYNPSIQQTKEAAVFTFNDNLNIRTLYLADLTLIPKTFTNEVNERQRNRVNLRGWKIYMQANNLFNDTLTFNMAIIAPKQGNSVSTALFFGNRTDDSGGSQFANTLDNIIFSKFPINTDFYTVLMHKRYYLNTVGANASNNQKFTRESGKSFLNLAKYIPLKRQVRYTGSGDQSDDKVFLVWWCDILGATSGTAALSNRAKLGVRVHTVFKEQP